MTAVGPPTVVIGIDPGNDSAGVAVMAGPDLIAHYTLRLWARPVEALGPLEGWPLRYVSVPAEAPVRFVVEVPSHGPHATRGGIHWAAGALVERIRAGLGLEPHRDHVLKVRVSDWRGYLGFRGDRDACKAQALAHAAAHGLRPVESEDEAEAIGIAQYGASLFLHSAPGRKRRGKAASKQ